MIDVGNTVFEAMLKEAVKSNFQAKMKAMPNEEQLLKEYPPSCEHIRKMKSLFKWEHRRNVTRSILSFAKAAVLVLCAAVTVLFAALIISPQVRAAVRDTVVQFFESFTRIEFNTYARADKKATDFSLGYVPDGYARMSVTEYGDAVLVTYGDSENNMLLFNISPPDTHTVDSENADYHVETYSGITYYIYEAAEETEYSNIAWSQDGYVFSLMGIVSVDELMKTALSLE